MMFDSYLKPLLNESSQKIKNFPGLMLKNSVDKSILSYVVILIIIFLYLVFNLSINDPEYKLSNNKSDNISANIYKAEKSDWQNICSELSYKFLIDGAEFLGKETVSKGSHYCTIRKGGKINIRYLVSSPSINKIESEISEESLPYGMLFFILFIFISFLFVRTKYVFRDRRIFSKGIHAKANLIFVKKIGDKASSFAPSTLYFEFMTDSGEKIETTAYCTNEWLVNQLHHGSELNILYLPKKPNKAMVLEAYIK